VDVFAFFRDIDQHPRRADSIVPVYDRITTGPTGVGTRYREVIRLLPSRTGEMLSEITCYEPEHRLGYRFCGLGMEGNLVYDFEATPEGTLVIQKQSLCPLGLLALLRVPIRAAFSRMAGRRLQDIKRLLESNSGFTG
jgi:hypothetical protein